MKYRFFRRKFLEISKWTCLGILSCGPNQERKQTDVSENQSPPSTDQIEILKIKVPSSFHLSDRFTDFKPDSQPKCDICLGGGAPGKNTPLEIAYLGLTSCNQLYEMGRTGNLHAELCYPLQLSLTEEDHCACPPPPPPPPLDIGGAVVTASQEPFIGQGHRAIFAFDDRLETYWKGVMHDFERGRYENWIQYQFAKDKAVVVTSYSVSVSDRDTRNHDPRDWTLLASNDGSNWIEVDSQSEVNFESKSQKIVFEFENTEAYSRYRLHITETKDPVSLYLEIAEIEYLVSDSDNGCAVDDHQDSDNDNEEHQTDDDTQDSPTRYHIKYTESDIDLIKKLRLLLADSHDFESRSEAESFALESTVALLEKIRNSKKEKKELKGMEKSLSKLVKLSGSEIIDAIGGEIVSDINRDVGQ